MTLNVNGTAMSLVNVNGTRMEVVNVNGTEVYRAQNGNVTLVSVDSLSFSPGLEDINRHFVLVGVNFSGSAFGSQPVPTVNGIGCNSIISSVGNGGGDGGIAGIFTVKIPTGTGTFTIANSGSFRFSVYRVTGCVSMATALAAFNTGGNSTQVSSANGCFFGASVSNFSNAPTPTPNSSGLVYVYSSVAGTTAASNTTTGPTQSVGLNGNQINAGATFGYDLF